MNAFAPAQSSLPKIIRNDAGLYEGNLAHYFRAVFFNAQNLNHPYHNFRHMLHVTVMCYEACEFYRDQMIPREMRNLLIAALGHDFDHSGMKGQDDLNIVRALRWIDQYALPEDLEHRGDIGVIVRATEFPHVGESAGLSLSEKIIRDADLSQALSAVWLQEIVFGLAKEWNIKPQEVLKMQETFLSSLQFCTAWGRHAFPQRAIYQKVCEINELLGLLNIKT